MLKNLSCLESVVGEKVGRFYLDNDTPLISVKEMLFQFSSLVAKIEEQANEMKAREAEEQAAKEGETVVVPEILEAE